MSKKEKRITTIPPKKPNWRTSTMPFRDFTKPPLKDIKANHKIDLLETWEEVQCIAGLSGDKTKVVFETEDLERCEIGPIDKLKDLLDGKVETIKLTCARPVEPEPPKKPRFIQRPRRFVVPTRDLTPEEVEYYRLHGYIPWGKKIGNPARSFKQWFDKQTVKELEETRRFLEEKTGEKLTFNEIVRLMVLEGLRVTKENEVLKETQKRDSTEDPEETLKEG